MTLFKQCELPAAINPLGWHNWGKPENEKTARYEEYNNAGKGSDSTQRVQWMKLLTPGEAQKVTLENVMGRFTENIHRAL
jgi:pectinesterase